MFRCLTIFWILLFSSGHAWTEEPASFPKGLPPVFGTAIAHSGKPHSLAVTLTCPQARWQVVGSYVENPDAPKLSKWPEFRVHVERVVETISVIEHSPRTQTRIVGIDGEALRREDILKRLEKETPVLIAIDGRMVDPYYLQVAKPETLIILIGPWDGSPATELLPGPARRNRRSGQIQRRHQ